MARIIRIVRGGRFHVSIRGALSVRDLARLERACAPALEHERLPLEIHMDEASATDEVSRRYLARLATRGAAIRAGAIGRR